MRKYAWLSLYSLGALFTSGSVLATTSTELTVSGTLSQPACNVIPPGNGTYDFGQIIPAAQQRSGGMTLPAITQTWQVRCDGETYLAVIPTDNRMSTRSKTGEHYFGLGNGENGKPLGYFQLSVAQTAVEAATVAPRNLGNNAVAHGGIPLKSGVRTDLLAQDRSRAGGRNYLLDITVMPYLAGDVPVTETASLDGSVTLNFAFGL